MEKQEINRHGYNKDRNKKEIPQSYSTIPRCYIDVVEVDAVTRAGSNVGEEGRVAEEPKHVAVADEGVALEVDLPPPVQHAVHQRPEHCLLHAGQVVILEE